MKQTAVEWLMDQITSDNGLGQRRNSFTGSADLSSYFNKAKEMEKEQMCQFANAWDKELSDGVIRSVEDCFEATFKTKDK